MFNNIRITPLVEQFDDPYYPVLLEDVPVGSKLQSEVVIYEDDRHMGKFNFGKLESIIQHWPKATQNTLRQRIKDAVFDALKQ